MKKHKSSTQLPEPYFNRDDRFRLFHGDCIAMMESLPEESVDMIYADPPYFLSSGGITCKSGKMAPVDKGKWDRPESMREVHEFNRAWLQACRRVLAPDGAIWISGTSHNIFSVGQALGELGFRLLNDIVWRKGNPPPNLGCRCFKHSTEWILWASKSKKSKHVFNYKEMKEEAGDRQMDNVWNFNAPPPSEKKFGKHPTQKPIALLSRIIRAGSNPGAVILDPFNGSGTTGITAYMLHRNFIGIDISQEFLDLTIKRFEDVFNSNALFCHNDEL